MELCNRKLISAPECLCRLLENALLAFIFRAPALLKRIERSSLSRMIELMLSCGLDVPRIQ